MVLELLVAAVVNVFPGGEGAGGALQQAIDRGAGNTLVLAPGTYREKVVVPGACTNLHLVAARPGESVIVWDDYAAKLDARGKEIGTGGSYTLKVAADGFTAEGLVIANAASDANVASGGRGVGQAVALHVTGDGVVFSNCTIRSYQDTLYAANGRRDGAPSRQHFVDCRIEGSVDFIFGSAAALFTRCDLVLRQRGWVTAASTPEGQSYGYIFDRCRLSGLTDEKSWLGRPWREYAQTVFLDCEMGDCLAAEGWQTWRPGDGCDQTVYYAEFGSKGPGAKGPRVAWAHTHETAARYLRYEAGAIELLPALAREEIPGGVVKGLVAEGGFVFNLAWRENKLTEVTVVSTRGGPCRLRRRPELFSPILKKQGGDQVFDTAPGEVVVLRGTSDNQDWTRRAERFTDAFLKTDEARRIAANVLDYQLVTGGWPKNVPMDYPLSARERAALVAQKGEIVKGTIDNGATMAELRFLARMYKATGRTEYLEAFTRGIEFLLYLQYPNGGWPQCDPHKKGYWAQITFNDGAMVGAMETLRAVYEARAPYDLPFDAALKARCRAAFDKGVDCILRTQLVQNGCKTIWCQQYDKETLKPCIGRAFELPSLSTAESLGIVRLLMSLPRTPEIAAAIEGAVAWWPTAAVRGFAVERNWRRPDGVKASRLAKVDPATHPPLWARYYTLEENRPFWASRDSEKHFTFDEMLRGENMTYQWWNASGEAVARDYRKWKQAGK